VHERLAAALRSGDRNFELFAVALALGFLVLGALLLARSPAGLPVSANALIAQVAATFIALNIGLRVLTPSARAIAPAPLLLAALGLLLVIRLAPEVADDQANWVSLGAVAALAGAWLGERRRWLRRFTYTWGFLAVLLLAFTGLFGETINGARLWVVVAGQSVQTTEFIKVLLILFVAGYLSQEAGGLRAEPTWRSWRYLLPLGVFFLSALAALALLRDLGTMAILAATVVLLVWVATGRTSYLLLGALLLVGSGLLGYELFGHVRARVDAWLHPFDDPLGTGYQTVQATFALANGGVTGGGPGFGLPDIIPAAPTDFVFAAIVEELGAAGGVAVILLFLAWFTTGLQVASRTVDEFDRALAAGITLLLSVQAAVILAGNLRLIPATGVTLPFVSYGGSSLVVNFGLVGLLSGLSQANAAHDPVLLEAEDDGPEPELSART